MSPDTRVLDIQGLHIRFHTDDGLITAVDGVDLNLEEGETLALVGESGSGKSVTARAVLRLLPDTAELSGRILLAGRDLTGMGRRELRAARGAAAAMVFQEPSTTLNPVQRIGQQIREGLAAHRITGQQAKQTALRLLDDVGIPRPEEALGKYPHEFSGGQKQRIVIAMALALRPKLIIADEPTTALDVTVQAQILDLLRQCQDEYGAAILLISHNMGVVADLADRVAVMRDGRIVEDGTAGQLFPAPRHDYTKLLLSSVPRIPQLEIAPAPADEPAAAAAAAPAEFGGEVLAEANELVLTYPRTLSRPEFTALDHIDLTIRRGEVLGLVGESGSGKTTLGRAIAGLARPTGGSLRVFGTELVGENLAAFRAHRSRIGFVFQDPATSFNPRMTVAESIAEPLLAHKKAANLTRALPRVHQLLDAVQLAGSYAARFTYELSGGQRQRVSLARALALDPDLVIADEPTSALDVSVQAKVLELFRQLQADIGFGALFITHDLAVVAALADHVVVLRNGRIAEEGPTRRLLTRPADDYTRLLLASFPVADPVEQQRRRDALRLLQQRALAPASAH